MKECIFRPYISLIKFINLFSPNRLEALQSSVDVFDDKM